MSLRPHFWRFCRFWEYDSRRILKSSGLIKRYGLPLSLANMNAVFIWEKNQITYFFKGTQYWRYNEWTRRTVRGPSRNPYPRKIRSAWKFPDHIDTAVTWLNGKSYVFLGSQYLRLKKGKLLLDGRRRNTARRWMKCRSTTGFSFGALASGPSSSNDPWMSSRNTILYFISFFPCSDKFIVSVKKMLLFPLQFF